MSIRGLGVNRGIGEKKEILSVWYWEVGSTWFNFAGTCLGFIVVYTIALKHQDSCHLLQIPIGVSTWQFTTSSVGYQLDPVGNWCPVGVQLMFNWIFDLFYLAEKWLQKFSSTPVQFSSVQLDTSWTPWNHDEGWNTQRKVRGCYRRIWRTP